MRQTWEVLIHSSNVNTTPELRIFVSTGFLRFFRRFPLMNVGGDSAHLSSFAKRTREPRLRSPAKGHVATHMNFSQNLLPDYCNRLPVAKWFSKSFQLNLQRSNWFQNVVIDYQCVWMLKFKFKCEESHPFTKKLCVIDYTDLLPVILSEQNQKM